MRNLAITAISSVSLLFGGCATVDLSEVMKNDGVDLYTPSCCVERGRDCAP